MTGYAAVYQHVLRPLYDSVRRRPTSKLRNAANSRQWLPPDKLKAFQWTELQNLLRHAYEFSPWYRERLAAHGIKPDDVKTPADYLRIPIISKDDIRAHRDEMLATNYRGRVYEHKTGGSTGMPLQFYVNRNSYDWRLAVSMRGYGWAGCFEGQRQLFVWGAPIGTPPLKQLLKTKLHNAVLRREIISSFGFSDAAMSACVHRINTFRPRTLVGYTNALVLLAQHILDRGMDVVRPSAVITAAEGVNTQQRALIERAFGAPVFASYGSREFMLIAMECDRHSGLHISSDNLYVEVMVGDRPAAAGEIGEIVVTDLHNFGMPFIRYRIGDLGITTSNTCTCGRGLSLLERVEGRVLDAVRTPDGRIVPGEFFPHLFKEFDSVKQFQVVQKTLQHLHIKVLLRDGNRTDDLARLEIEIRKVLGTSIGVRIEVVSEIPLTASGKFRVTVSEL